MAVSNSMPWSRRLARFLLASHSQSNDVASAFPRSVVTRANRGYRTVARLPGDHGADTPTDRSGRLAARQPRRPAESRDRDAAHRHTLAGHGSSIGLSRCADWPRWWWSIRPLQETSYRGIGTSRNSPGRTWARASRISSVRRRTYGHAVDSSTTIASRLPVRFCWWRMF